MILKDRASGRASDSEITPPKFNMEPEDHGFQKEFPFPGTFFRFHVKFWGCILKDHSGVDLEHLYLEPQV